MAYSIRKIKHFCKDTVPFIEKREKAIIVNSIFLELAARPRDQVIPSDELRIPRYRGLATVCRVKRLSLTVMAKMLNQPSLLRLLLFYHLTYLIRDAQCFPHLFLHGMNVGLLHRPHPHQFHTRCFF